jgi:ATP-dependent exoDNAse (exonuclease V) beta subunit
MEALRLLYVGCTRARDYLIIPFRNDLQQCWLEMILPGGPETLGFENGINCDTVIENNEILIVPFRLWVTSYDNVAADVIRVETESRVYAHGKQKIYEPYLINPSGSSIADVLNYEEGLNIHDAFLTGLDAGEEKADFGTFVHNVICAFHPSMSDRELIAIIQRVGAAQDCKPDFQNTLVQQIRAFYNWIDRSFDHTKIHKELPAMMEGNGQLTVGVMDMVVETETSVTVIDYKTFTGDKAAMQWKAKSFSGQLQLYMDILKRGFRGKQVRGAIYFVMMGEVVWVK